MMGSKCLLKQHDCLLYLLYLDVPIPQSVKDLAKAEVPQELGLYSNTTNMQLCMMFCAGHRLGLIFPALIISTDLKLFNTLSLHGTLLHEFHNSVSQWWTSHYLFLLRNCCTLVTVLLKLHIFKQSVLPKHGHQCSKWTNIYLHIVPNPQS